MVRRGSSPPAQLETERLLLRLFRDGDLDDLRSILGDAETMRFYPRAYTSDEVRDWIARNIQCFRRTGLGMWAIELKETGEFVGDSGITDQNVNGVIEPEIGWHVRRSHWGRGIATEAALSHRDRAMGELGMSRLISLIRPENTASRRVAEKLGMTVENETDRSGLRHLVYATGHST